MFCPLCKAEYRVGFTRCADCGADLVVSLDAPEVRGNPPVLLWRATVEKIFAQACECLSDNNVPYRVIEPSSAIERRVRPAFDIWVLRADFDRAFELVTTAAEKQGRMPGSHEPCVFCGAIVEAGFSRCPKCKKWLMSLDSLPPESATPPEQPVPDITVKGEMETTSKHCPLCGTPYPARFSHCTECGIQLIAGALSDGPHDERAAREPLVITWRGSDPIAAGRILGALRGAGVSAFPKWTHDHLVFGLAIPRPMYEIFVFRSDFEVTRYLIAPIKDEAPFSPHERIEGDESSAEGSRTESSSVSGRKWYPQQATEQVWMGDDPGMAEMLKRCFAENSIAYRQGRDSSGAIAFFARPEEADRARQIVLEIAENLSMNDPPVSGSPQ